MEARHDIANASFGRVPEDALLLHEFTHRTGNEIAAASAALHLAKRMVTSGALRMIELAVDRLEAFGELHRVLARPVTSRADVSRDLIPVCRAIAAGSPGAAGNVVSLDVSLRITAGDIVLVVRDDGPGMRAGAVTSGTGLGRGIVTELVERARGAIATDSGLTGTTVRVSLPLDPGDTPDDGYVF